jgi:hypothetical protein
LVGIAEDQKSMIIISSLVTSSGIASASLFQI